jgi:hypothetical protein
LPWQRGSIFAHWASVSTNRSICGLNHKQAPEETRNLNSPYSDELNVITTGRYHREEDRPRDFSRQLRKRALEAFAGIHEQAIDPAHCIDVAAIRSMPDLESPEPTDRRKTLWTPMLRPRCTGTSRVKFLSTARTRLTP